MKSENNVKNKKENKKFNMKNKNWIYSFKDQKRNFYDNEKFLFYIHLLVQKSSIVSFSPSFKKLNLSDLFFIK